MPIPPLFSSFVFLLSCLAANGPFLLFWPFSLPGHINQTKREELYGTMRVRREEDPRPLQIRKGMGAGKSRTSCPVPYPCRGAGATFL